MEYHLTIKGDDVLIHGTTQMNFENMILSEKGQLQKTVYLYEMSQNLQRERLVEALPAAGKKEEWGVTTNGMKFLTKVMKMF